MNAIRDEIKRCIEMYDISQILNYQVCDLVFSRYYQALNLGIDIQAYPFIFTFGNVFYGLQFIPNDELHDEIDLYLLLMEKCIIRWILNSGYSLPDNDLVLSMDQEYKAIYRSDKCLDLYLYQIPYTKNLSAKIVNTNFIYNQLNISPGEMTNKHIHNTLKR